MYRNPKEIVYRSARNYLSITVPEGYESDGATGAIDIYSWAWWVHDVVCERGTWDDGTPITAWEAALVLHDVLLSEGRWIRARTWPFFTFLFGCKKVRENGWFRRKKR